MILYFTGTGNSAYVAKQLGEKLNDEVINLFEKIKNHDYSEVNSDKPFVFVYPTYAWQMPKILRDWIEKTKFSGHKLAYFVSTCGMSMGDTSKALQELCTKKGFQYAGCASVVMPENYIAMFPVPNEEQIQEILEKADKRIPKIAELIDLGTFLFMEKPKVLDKMLTAVVNQGFYKYAISAKKFYAKDSCIGCGKCVEVCPLSNVTLVNGKPKWGKNCTHCMACICKCPAEAIEYGKASEGKVRYQCPR